MNKKCEVCGTIMYFDTDGCACTAKKFSEQIKQQARYGSKPHLLLAEILRKAQDR